MCQADCHMLPIPADRSESLEPNGRNRHWPCLNEHDDTRLNHAEAAVIGVLPRERGQAGSHIPASPAP